MSLEICGMIIVDESLWEKKINITVRSDYSGSISQGLSVYYYSSNNNIIGDANGVSWSGTNIVREYQYKIPEGSKFIYMMNTRGPEFGLRISNIKFTD